MSNEPSDLHVTESPESGTGFTRSRITSFRYAFSGLGFILRTQQNAWIHLALAAFVVVAGLLVGLATTDWLWIASAIALVWFAETMNTGFEYLCDAVSPDHSADVEKAKDIAAGAVLICSVYAVVVGGLVFGRHLFG